MGPPAHDGDTSFILTVYYTKSRAGTSDRLMDERLNSMSSMKEKLRKQGLGIFSFSRKALSPTKSQKASHLPCAERGIHYVATRKTKEHEDSYS